MKSLALGLVFVLLLDGKFNKLSVKLVSKALEFSPLGVLGVDLTLELIKSLVLVGVGVDLEDFL